MSDERREQLARAVKALFREEFDRELSDFHAQRVLDLMIRHLGPPVYNQAIQDARAFFQSKLDDIDGEFYEPEAPYE